ncbi:MAG: TetR family transcriptional regulator [Polaromonas sp.]|nr:TetR family transcriptional regulator [Polaromonas sp.]
MPIRIAAVSDMEPPSPPRRPGRPASLEKRQAVIEAAIEEFAERGFDSASMDAIAAKALVAKRTLYNQYESKDGLFAALVGELAHRIVVSSTFDYRAGEGLREQLLAYAEESRDLMSRPANLQLLRAVLAEHIRHPHRVEPLLHKYWVTEYGFVSWMKAAKADGRLAGNPATMGHLMGALMKSIIFWPTVLGRSNPADPGVKKQVAEAIDMFLGRYAT